MGTTVNQRFYLRAVRHIVLCGFFTMAGCQDVTAPDNVAAVPDALSFSQSSATDELKSFGDELDGMTDWSLAALPNGQGLANIVGILNGLKGHLASGKIEACQQDITDARSILGGLTFEEQVEVGAVGVTLDVVQIALDKASQ